MFDNLGTALVQALGFFAVFGFFVYQTLFADRKPKNSKSNTKKNFCIKDIKIEYKYFTYLNQPFFFGLISSLKTSFFLPNNPFFWTGKLSSTGLDFLLNKPFFGSFLIDSFVSEIFIFLRFDFEFLDFLSANRV